MAAQLVTDPLPPDRPLWSATLITGLADSSSALVVLFHHVLADGMGGLAVLATLVDGSPAAPPDAFPRARPPWRTVARDANAGRIRALAHIARVPTLVRGALAEMRPGSAPPAPRSSLNRPVGTRRRFRVARADLDLVRAAGHAHEATVNDVVLAAAGSALDHLLVGRGERVDHLVVSVLVSGRTEASAADLGNQAGVMPVALPTGGERSDRLRAIAAATRRRKTAARGASTALLAPAFRAVRTMGVLRLLVQHQHRVNAFTTNLRGPETRVGFMGRDVVEVIPLTVIAGNVAIAFAAFSYAGSLTVTVTVDPEVVPDDLLLVGALQRALDSLCDLGT